MRAALSPRHRGWAAAAALVAATAGVAGWWLHVGRSRPADVRVESLTGIVERRPVVPRFHGAEWKPRPNDRVRGPNAATLEPGAWHYQKSLDEARVAAGESPAGAQLQRLGAAYVLAGNADEGLQTLQRATAAVPDDAQALSDLGAAYLARGIARDDGNDMAQALETIDRALEAAPDSLEAKFNRAVALQELPLPNEAARAWQAYLDLDSRSDWAREARSQLDELAKRNVEASSAAQLRVEIVAASTAADGSLVGLVRAHRQEAREAFMLDLLPAWGSAVVEGDEAEAAARLDAARRLAGEWNRQTDDRSLLRQVAEVEAAGGEREGFARGHQDLAKAIEALEDLKVEIAAASLRSAREQLPHSSRALAWAEMYSVACDFYRQGPTTALSRRLEELQRATEDEPLKAYLAWLRGLLHFRRGEPQALALYDQALAEFDRLGEADNALWLHSLSADASTLFGDLPRAWSHRRQVLAGLPRLAHRERRFPLLLGPAIGAAYLEDRPRLASALFEELSPGDTVWPARQATELELWRSRVQLKLGDREEARSTLRAATAWLWQIDDAALRRRFAADLQVANGMAAEPGEASLASISTSIDRMRKGSPDFRFPGLLLERARTYRLLGQPQLAAADLREGIDWLLRQSPDGSVQALLSEQLSGGEALFDELVAIELDAGSTDRAFAVAELARSRVFANEGARSPQPTSPLPAEYAASSVRALQKQLDPGTTLLSFCLLAKEAILWRVDSAGTAMVRLDARPAELTAWAAQLETDLAAGAWTPQTRAAARSLYAALVSPARLPPDIGRLVIVPDRRLDRVPFAALVDPHDRFLVEQHAVEVAPSATAFLAARARAKQLGNDQPSVLVVGNPQLDPELYPGLEPLPGAAAEAREVAQLYARHELLLGARASRDAVLARSGSFDVVHFAGHAVVNPVDPSRSSLALARGPGSADPGALFAYEISPRRFERVRTVVLAGCGTGNGPQRSDAGTASLAQAFLAARVPSVVASLWPVLDHRTAEMMTVLHSRLSRGDAAVDALRAAQLEVLHSADLELRSPATWAAFRALGG